MGGNIWQMPSCLPSENISTTSCMCFRIFVCCECFVMPHQVHRCCSNFSSCHQFNIDVFGFWINMYKSEVIYNRCSWIKSNQLKMYDSLLNSKHVANGVKVSSVALRYR